MGATQPEPSDAELQRQREQIRRALLRVNLAASLILVVVVGLAVAAIIQANRAERHAREAREATIRVEGQRIEAEKSEQRAREELRQSYLTQTRAARLAGLAGSRFDGLKSLAAAAKIRVDSELRSEAIACLSLTDLRESPVRQKIGANQTVPIFNADLSRYAIADYSGVIRVHQVSDNRVLAELTGPGIPVGWTRFSPDNRYVSVRHLNGLVRLWDLSATNLIFSTQAAFYMGFDGAIDFSPNSKNIVIAHGADSTRLYEIATGLEQKRFATGPKPFAVRFSPDGRLLAVSDDSDLQIWRVASGAKEKTFRINSGNINKVHWAPTGQAIAAAGFDGNVYLWDIDTGIRRVFSGHGAAVIHVAFNNSGRLLVSDAFNGETRLWDVRAGKTMLTTQSGFGTWFTPDDLHLGYVRPNEQLGLWEVMPGDAFHLMPPEVNPSPPGEITESQTQGLRALLSSPKEIQLQGIPTGEALAVLNPPADKMFSGVRFDPEDGSLVATARDGGRMIWELPQIGRQLAAIGLGWGQRTSPVKAAPLPVALATEPWSGQSTFTLLALSGVTLAVLTGVLVLRRHWRLITGLATTEALVVRRNRELELAQAELLHSQKMRALGTLAAGIAHDFNNLLSIIRMANKLNAREAKDNPEIQDNSADIEQAVEQGKTVVRSMLGFGREPSGQVAPFSLPELVEDSVALLSKQFLNGITLTLELDRTCPPINGSKGRLEQILLNLLVNASEAMNGEGKLLIAARLAAGLPDQLVLRPKESPRHLELIVADSGPGIATDVVARIFEPFFTTKMAGAQRGTGLGLSMVYTIAQQDGLGIRVETTRGTGTVFRILIPAG
ncbi:MAG: hypothetical protein H7X97_03805 [Opitutaceae bacterium]|nr:hypothetical protein [Verrucomicrobiales bacterium]